MKNTFFISLFILSFGHANAQVSIAPVAGLNIAGYAAQKDSRYMDPQLNKRNGFCGGALVIIPFTRKLSLQTGLLHKMNGYWNTFHGETPFGVLNVRYTQRVSTLELPCKLMYSFRGKRGNSFFLGAGPYFAVNVASSERTQGEANDYGSNAPRTIDEIHYDKPNEEMTKRYDAGAGIMAGYQSRKGILVCLQGQRGWMDARTLDWDWQAVNYNFGIVGGYAFKLKKRKAHIEEPRSGQ